MATEAAPKPKRERKPRRNYQADLEQTAMFCRAGLKTVNDYPKSDNAGFTSYCDGYTKALTSVLQILEGK